MMRLSDKNAWRSAIAIVGIAAIVSGCGGSGSQDSAPRIGALMDQVANQDTTIGPIPVAVTSATTDLQFSAAVKDENLVPPGNVMLSGTGSSRSLTLVPASDQTGSTEVTIVVRDALGHVVSSGFRLTVNPVYAGFTQYADTAFQADPNAAPLAVSGLTFQPDADGNPDAFTALVQ